MRGHPAQGGLHTRVERIAGGGAGQDLGQDDVDHALQTQFARQVAAGHPGRDRAPYRLWGDENVMLELALAERLLAG